MLTVYLLLLRLACREMLSNLVTRYEGKAANWLQRRASASADSTVEALFVETVALWEARKFLRVSDEETCCTVPFFDCCDQILELNQDKYPRIRILYNGAHPTREMRAGLVHPKTAPIPDLTLVFGLMTFTIEAKRLALGEGLPRKYVREGMRRFIDKKYKSSPGRAGFMFGFVVRDNVHDIIGSINAAIIAEKDLNAADQLDSITDPLSKFCRCESKHADGLRLVHGLVDVKS
jgi:hypothetical protein